MYVVQCTSYLYITCTMYMSYIIHIITYNIRRILYDVRRTIYVVQHVPYIVDYKLIPRLTVNGIQCTHHTVYSVMHCTMYSEHCTHIYYTMVDTFFQEYPLKVKRSFEFIRAWMIIVINVAYYRLFVHDLFVHYPLLYAVAMRTYYSI